MAPQTPLDGWLTPAICLREGAAGPFKSYFAKQNVFRGPSGPGYLCFYKFASQIVVSIRG